MVLLSVASGWIGMQGATAANVRTAEAARSSGQAAALRVAFGGGSIMGLAVASLGLAGIAIVFAFLAKSEVTNDAKLFAEIISGFAMGASSIALFARVGGGIYTKARSNYNTAICLMALVLRARPEDEEIIRRARNFVAHQQNDADTPGKTDNPFDGGIGYGGAQQGAHADLSNTSFALEALYYSKKLFEDTGKPVEKKDDLNWDAAIQFVSRCQNLKASNDQPWAGVDKDNTGAFGYTPVPQAPRGGKKDGGPVPMRYYGSISYAGMLSFIYAGLTPSDPRMVAALEWLGNNYTVDENPGMGAEGLFYYYHTMAKALATAGVTQLKTKSGSANWTADLSRKLISLQNSDGSWANIASGRWMESDPVLVTAYTVLALEQVHRAMK